MAKRFIYLILLTLLSVFVGACSRQTDQQAQGYIEGRYTYMATSVSGVLTQLLVHRGSTVKQGQTLFVLEEQPESDMYRSAIENLTQSIASRDAVAANLTYAKLRYERDKILVPKKAIQQSELDNAKSMYEANIAQLAQANANIASTSAVLAQMKWSKDQKTVYAPVNAIVFDTYYRLGERTIANQAILSLLAPADIKAIFYIPEIDLGAIKLGDKVSVRCDGCKKNYDGYVSFISPSAEYTPPVIYSNDTTEKLIYRIEAEFAAQDAYNLHPGQPVIVNYKFHE